MKKDDKASISLKKVLIVSMALLLLMGISVFAVGSKVKNVKIILSDGYEMNVLTTKEKVSDILNENYILLLDNEIVIPSLESNISDNKTIKITTDNNINNIKTTEVAQTSNEITAERLLEENYSDTVEKIVVEQTTIPFETETKDLSNGSASKREVVKQNGIDGIKETKYKVKYQNNVEISKAEISSAVVKEPQKKIVEVVAVEVVSRSNDQARNATQGSQTVAVNAAANGNSLAARVQGITPSVVTLNASAYTASTCDKAPGSSGYGITACGVRASAWCTVAAGRGYKMGTIIYIPYFANKPNGGWFIVQDRGGAISNNKLDIYMNTYNECISFGRRNLQCYIYEF